jgi:hypothetical protein
VALRQLETIVDGEHERRILDLIAKVYDAALDEPRWKTIAQEIADTFNSSSAVLQLQNRVCGSVKLLSLTQNFDEWALKA